MRFHNAGRVTQYEIALIPYRVGRSWKNAWAGVSDDFHPKSELDWQLNQGDDDAACERD